VTDSQRDRIAAAFDRELARSPLPTELRAQAVHNAIHNRNSNERERPPRIVALVAALLAVAIVAALVLTARSLHSRQVVPANPVIPANPIPLPKSGALGPGTYVMTNPNVDANGNCVRACSAYRKITFTLPVGWTTINGLVYKHLNQSDEAAFSVWSVRDVYDDPCHWQTTALSPLDVESTSYDPATGTFVLRPYKGGLAHQSLRGPLPRVLTSVTFAFVDASGASWPTGAFRIDLSVPAGMDISTCDKGEFRSWPVSYNGAEVNNAQLLAVDAANSHNAPGQLDAVYMLAVDRWPLVIDASHMPGTSQADLAELQAIIASMIVDRG